MMKEQETYSTRLSLFLGGAPFLWRVRAKGRPPDDNDAHGKDEQLHD
jgi:hypothetical protein